MRDDEYFADYMAFYQIKRQHFKNKPFLADIKCSEYVENGSCLECGRRAMYYVKFYLNNEEVGMLCSICSSKDMSALECVRFQSTKNDTSPLREP